MTVLGRLMERRYSLNLSNPANPVTSEALDALFGGYGRSDAGVAVNESSALGMPAVWRAVNLIAGTCASLPLKTYKANTKERATVRLLDNPHPDKTRFELWEYAYTSCLLWGNSYQRKVRNNVGNIVWLEPIPPSCVKVGRPNDRRGLPADGKLFEVTDPDGGTEVFDSGDILHIPAFGYDGVCGASPIRMARQAIGLGLAAEQYGARLFGSGSLMSGILQTDQRLDEDAATRLKKRWQATVGGVGNSHEIAVLGSGAKFQPVTMPNSDAQFIESRRFQIAEIGRWFGLPGHMLGDTEKSTTWGSGIEHMSIGMVVYTLRPTWLTRFEQRITKEITPPQTYAEYAVEGLLRGDSEARANFYTTLRQMGVLSANEIRAMENLPPIDGGDEYLVPLNMTPQGQEPEETPDANPDDTPSLQLVASRTPRA